MFALPRFVVVLSSAARGGWALRETRVGRGHLTRATPAGPTHRQAATSRATRRSLTSISPGASGASLRRQLGPGVGRTFMLLGSLLSPGKKLGRVRTHWREVGTAVNEQQPRHSWSASAIERAGVECGGQRPLPLFSGGRSLDNHGLARLQVRLHYQYS